MGGRESFEQEGIEKFGEFERRVGAVNRAKAKGCHEKLGLPLWKIHSRDLVLNCLVPMAIWILLL